MSSFGTKPFSEKGNRKIFTYRKNAVFFRKFENFDKHPKILEWVSDLKIDFHEGPFQETVPNVNARVQINQPRGRGNVGKGGHSPSSSERE